MTLKTTLSDRRKRKWRKLKRKNRVIRIPRKSAKVSDFVEVALARSNNVNVTGNRKHRKRICKDSRQGLKNDKLKNFSGNKEAIIEEEHNTDVPLSNKIDRQKDSSKSENPAKGSLLYSEITRSNLIEKKRQTELSCELIENETLCNTSREMALFEDLEENIEKNDQGTGNLSLSQSDSPLVDILSSLLKDEEKVPILTPNTKFSNTSTANNICTQGKDTSVSLSQRFLSSLLKGEEKVAILTPNKKLIILALLTTFVHKVMILQFL